MIVDVLQGWVVLIESQRQHVVAPRKRRHFRVDEDENVIEVALVLARVQGVVIGDENKIELGRARSLDRIGEGDTTIGIVGVDVGGTPAWDEFTSQNVKLFLRETVACISVWRPPPGG